MNFEDVCGNTGVLAITATSGYLDGTLELCQNPSRAKPQQQNSPPKEKVWACDAYRILTHGLFENSLSNTKSEEKTPFPAGDL